MRNAAADDRGTELQRGCAAGVSAAGDWEGARGTPGSITTITQVGCMLVAVSPGETWSPAEGHVSARTLHLFGLEGRLGRPRGDNITWSDGTVWERRRARFVTDSYAGTRDDWAGERLARHYRRGFMNANALALMSPRGATPTPSLALALISANA